jgi:hypothetical protein
LVAFRKVSLDQAEEKAGSRRGTGFFLALPEMPEKEACSK